MKHLSVMRRWCSASLKQAVLPSRKTYPVGRGSLMQLVHQAILTPCPLVALLWREYLGSASWAPLLETVICEFGLELGAMQALSSSYHGCNEVGLASTLRNLITFPLTPQLHPPQSSYPDLLRICIVGFLMDNKLGDFPG